MVARGDLLHKARHAKRESKYVDFKEQFDPDSSRDWVELVKDIVAMANSGGGVIIVGARNNGTPSGHDITPFLNVDPAHFTDKIAKYTGEQFAGLEIEQIERHGQEAAALAIEGISIPMVFLQTGAYEIAPKRQKTAFQKGTVYFRHGAKSEPGNSADLRRVVNGELARIRKSWLSKIRKVVGAPPGSSVAIVSPEELASAATSGFRLTDDPDAPVIRSADPNRTHPHRLTEVVWIFNERLAGKKQINFYDVQCIRKTYKTDRKRLYFYKPRFASPRYSDAFVDWLVRQYEKEPSFFDEARKKVRRKLRRKEK